jgi:capsular exopolysaccharide synthesis family protein
MEEYLQLWSVIKRRWLPTSLVFLTLVALSIVKTILETPIYQASGQLVLKKNSTSSLTGIGSQLGQLENSVSGRPLGTEVAVLRSIPLAEKTINTLGLNINPLVFLKDLQVRNIDNTDILEVFYIAEDPKTAASVVNTLMDIYIENDIEANRSQTRSARDFIAQQLPLRKAALQAAERRLQLFKQQNRVLDLEAEASSTVSIITALDKQVADTKSELASKTAQMQSIQELFGTTSQDAVIAGFVGESPLTTSVLTELQDIQQKIAVTGLRLTDNHPTMIDLKKQEVILKEELEKRIEQSFIGQSGRLNEITAAEDIAPLGGGLQQEILSQFASTESERLSLQVRLKSLADVIESYKQRADKLPQLGLQQSQLEREIAATESSYQNLLARYQELQVAENLQVSNARVITPALIPAVPIRSRQYINLLQGFIGGIVLGVATAFVLEKFDKTVKTSESVQDLLDYTLLGYIPPFPNGSFNSEVIVRKQPDNYVSESFRMLHTNLRFFNGNKSIKVIVVSSAVPREGKSTVSANLAFSISQSGRNVLLVDADLRNPSQHQIWEIPNEVGLGNILNDQMEVDQAITEITPNLDVLTAGPVNHNPAVLLDSHKMTAFLAQVSQQYDFIIIDTPPLTLAADATILGKLVNGILFVVRPGVIDSKSISLSKEMLEKADQNVLGVAINGTSANERYQYYDYAGSKVY